MSFSRQIHVETQNVKPQHRREATPRWRLSDTGFVILLLILGCLFFWKIFIHSTHIVDFGDTVKQHYPWRHFASTTPGGVRPLWLPFTNGGEPLVANPQVALFYPVDRSLSAVLPTHLALGYGFVLHIFLSGLFMYLLARHLITDTVCSFVSAAVFMFSAYVITQAYAGHYPVIAAVPWMPITFLLGKLAVDKTSLLYTLLMTIPLGLQLLAGHPQTSFLTLILLGLYVTFRCVRHIYTDRAYQRALVPFVLLAVALGVALGLSAIQLVPSYEFHRHATRAGGVSYWFATLYSFPFHGITGILLPNLFGTPLDQSYLNTGEYWEFALYVGVLPPILITVLLYLRKLDDTIVFLLGVAFLSLMLALGGNTPLYWPLWKFVPGFGVFRVPARFLLLFTLTAALLTGMGFKALRETFTDLDARRIRTIIKTLSIIALLLLAAVLAAYVAMEPLIEAGKRVLHQTYLSLDTSRHPYDWYLERLRPAYMSARRDAFALVLLILGGIVLLFWRLKEKTTTGLFSIVSAAFIVANLWIYHGTFVLTGKVTDIYREPGHVRFLKGNADAYRVYDRDIILRHNLQVVYGIHTLDGYNLSLRKHDSVYRAVHGSPLNESRGALSLLNVKYVLSKYPLGINWLRQVFQEDTIYIYENINVLPKAFVVPESELKLYRSLADKESRMNADSRARVAGVRMTSYMPNEITVEAEMKRPEILVLSEIHYPGWHAYVNGREQEILEAFGILRGVRLEEGKHSVKFVFEADSLRLGMYISSITLGALVITLAIVIIGKLKGRARK